MHCGWFFWLTLNFCAIESWDSGSLRSDALLHGEGLDYPGVPTFHIVQTEAYKCALYHRSQIKPRRISIWQRDTQKMCQASRSSTPKCILNKSYSKPDWQLFWYPEAGYRNDGTIILWKCLEFNKSISWHFSPPGLVATRPSGVSPACATCSTRHLSPLLWCSRTGRSRSIPLAVTGVRGVKAALASCECRPRRWDVSFL